MRAIQRTLKIGYIPNTGYYYYSNPNSITSALYNGFSPKIDFLARLDMMSTNDVENYELHEYFMLRHTIWYLLSAGKRTTPQVFVEEYRKFFAWFTQNTYGYMNNRYIRPFGPAGEQKQVGLIVCIFMLLHKFKLVSLFASVYCRG